MGMLAYYCATGYATLTVINGKDGQSLKELQEKMLKQSIEFKRTDAFLNDATGDYYTVSQVFSLMNSIAQSVRCFENELHRTVCLLFLKWNFIAQ